MRSALPLLLLILVAGTRTEQTCPCLTSLESYGIDTSLNISVTTSQGAHLYPSTYGLSSCSAHDRGTAPFCDMATPPLWCFHTWCYVNASECSAATTSSPYLAHHPRGAQVHFSYESCGSANAFSAWFAAFAGTIKLCSVFASASDADDSTPCGNTATHLQVAAMVDTINNLTGSLGFQVVAFNPSFPSYYKFSYAFHVYENGRWVEAGLNLSHQIFPQCDVIVGQGHGCSDSEIREQALVAHHHRKLYFTLRGPRAVLAQDDTMTMRLSPYFFSTHIRSDKYAHVSLRRIAQRQAALHAAGASSEAGASSTTPSVRIAILNFAENAFFDGVGREALSYAAAPGSGYEVVYNVSFATGDVCYPYSSSVPEQGAPGPCTPLAAHLDRMLAARPHVLLVSSLADGFAEVLEYLSHARPAIENGASTALATLGAATPHVLQALFWVGVPWLASGAMSCKGFGTHCAYALGATQISEYEADTFEDALLRRDGMPATCKRTPGAYTYT